MEPNRAMKYETSSWVGGGYLGFLSTLKYTRKMYTWRY